MTILVAQDFGAHLSDGSTRSAREMYAGALSRRYVGGNAVLAQRRLRWGTAPLR